MLLKANGIAVETPYKNAGGFYSIIYMGTYDPLLEVLGPNDVVVDGGANIGVFSILASRRARIVYAVEPHPTNYEFLVANLRANRAFNVIPLKAALFSRSGSLHLEGDGETAHLASTGPMVRTVTLDDIDRKDRITAVKLDIEGAEVESLLGQECLLRLRAITFERDKYHLDMLLSSRLPEVNPAWDYDLLLGTLKGLGFRIIRYDQARNSVIGKVVNLGAVRNEIASGFVGSRAFIQVLFGSRVSLLHPHSWGDNRDLNIVTAIKGEPEGS